MPCPCRSPVMPYRYGFRMCLSHFIYTVRPCLIHTCHAMPMPCSDHVVLLKATAQHGRRETAVLCCGLEKNGMVRAWHGRGMTSVNQTRPHCVNQMGKTHSKHLAARHGRGTAWARQVMCESALIVTSWRPCLLTRMNVLTVKLKNITSHELPSIQVAIASVVTLWEIPFYDISSRTAFEESIYLRNRNEIK